MKRFKTNRKIFFLPEFSHIIIYIYEKNFFFLFSIARFFTRNTPWKTICKADKWSFLASRIRIFARLNRWKPYDFLICTNFSTHKNLPLRNRPHLPENALCEENCRNGALHPKKHRSPHKKLHFSAQKRRKWQSKIRNQVFFLHRMRRKERCTNVKVFRNFCYSTVALGRAIA